MAFLARKKEKKEQWLGYKTEFTSSYIQELLIQVGFLSYSFKKQKQTALEIFEILQGICAFFRTSKLENTIK